MVCGFLPERVEQQRFFYLSSVVFDRPDVKTVSIFYKTLHFSFIGQLCAFFGNSLFIKDLVRKLNA